MRSHRVLHRPPSPPTITADPSTPEPVAIAAAVQAGLVAAVALGWVYLDDAAIAAVGTAVATIAYVATVLVARGRVRAIRPGDPPPPDPAAVDERVVALLIETLAARGLLRPPPAPSAPPTTPSPSPSPSERHASPAAPAPPRPRPYVGP